MASQSGRRPRCRKPLANAGLDHNALYHCQQAVEKALKAFLVWHQQPFRRTHDLEEIGQAVANLDISLGSITLEADALTDFAWRARYPGNLYTLAAGEVTAMLELAQRVLAEIKLRLSRPPQP